MVKPRFRHPQIAADGYSRDFQRPSNLINRQPAEITKLDRLAFARVEFLKSAETEVECYDVPISFLLKTHCLIERNSKSRSLAGISPPRMVHQDLAHQSR